MKKLLSFFILPALLLPFSVMAHPGHGDSDGYTIIHYFREPVHAVIPLVFFIALIAYIHMLEQRSRKKQKN